MCAGFPGADGGGEALCGQTGCRAPRHQISGLLANAKLSKAHRGPTALKFGVVSLQLQNPVAEDAVALRVLSVRLE